MRMRKVATTLFILITIYSIYKYKYNRLVTFQPATVTESPHNTREVYATLLCPQSRNTASKTNGIDFYYEATRVLTYRLLHKSSTKDIHNRQLIVLATELVLPEQIRQLRQDGAIVKVVAAIRAPKNINRRRSMARWRDQYTKLLLWQMTEYSKILYIDSDIIPIRPLSSIFDTPFSIDKEGQPYLFAATYDSSLARRYGRYSQPVPILGPDDKYAGDTPHAGLFLIHPSEKQSKYLQSLYDNPPQGQNFISFMEQSLLKYAYRDGGDYHWTRLSQMYNTQWPRSVDMNASYALHDKFWKRDCLKACDLVKYWFTAWGEMQGWFETIQNNATVYR